MALPHGRISEGSCFPAPSMSLAVRGWQCRGHCGSSDFCRPIQSRSHTAKRHRGIHTCVAAQGDENQTRQILSDPFEGGRQTRLSTRITTLPRRVDLYFAGNFVRQAVWTFIAFAIGFYSANTVSLSFGALAINDVVAAAVTVAFCEVCSRIYYSAPRVTLRLLFINSFKIGVIAALIADAFKLGG